MATDEYPESSRNPDERPGPQPMNLAEARAEIVRLRALAENARQSGESKYQRLFEVLNQGVVCQNRDGSIIEANRAAQHILGLSREQLLGRTSLDPRWQSVREDGTPMPGEEHPVMRALRLGQSVERVILGVRNPLWKEMRWLEVSAFPQFLPGEREPFQAFALFTDVTERLRIERALRYRELLLTIAQNTFPDGVLVVDENFKVVSWNTRFLEIWSLDPNWLGESDLKTRLHEIKYMLEDGEEFASRLIYLKEHPWETEEGYEMRFRDGRVIERHSRGLNDENGRNWGRLLTFRDVTDRILAERELNYRDLLFRISHKTAQDGILVMDVQDQIVFVNRKFLDIWGLSADWAGIPDPGQRLRMVRDKLVDPSGFEDRTLSLLHNPEDVIEGDEIIFKNGLVCERYSKALIDDDGVYWGRILTYRDITARKAAEESLRQSLREKDILLREVHHRVKNNLQIVSSLLTLQSRESDDPVMREYMAKSQARIRSMALVHDMLYRAENLGNVDLGTYVSRLAVQVAESFSIRQLGIVLDVRAGSVSLDLDRILPCGLIVNELLANALKYAFPSGRTGRIDIRLKEESRRVVLTVSDDGQGLPVGFAAGSTPSLGMKLVTALVEQLEGRLDVESSGQGTAFRVSFPL